jgi:hypothetical protein
LLKDYSDVKGDDKTYKYFIGCKIHPDTVSYSDTEMDRGADFVSFDGNPDVVCLNLTLALEEFIS